MKVVYIPNTKKKSSFLFYIEMRRGLIILRRISVVTTPPPERPDTDTATFSKRSQFFYKKFESWMTSYEEFIGIKQVKEAHARVLQAENEFVKSQEDRRQAQILMNSMQLKLREVRAELDRTPRGDHNYLDLVKREIELIRDEQRLRDGFEREERRERELFGILSSALRFSHEKERAQTEKTKYWSILASLIGASLGIIGTTINSQLKLRKLHEMLTENTKTSAAAVIEKLEQMTYKAEVPKSLLLQEFQKLREDVLSEHRHKNSFSFFADLEEQSNAERGKRRLELFLATGSVLLVVTFFIFKFSS